MQKCSRSRGALCVQAVARPSSHATKRAMRKAELRFNTVAAMPVYTLAAGLGIERSLKPVADSLQGLNLPEALIHWGHPANMAVVLFAMGGYGSYLGWQIRTSDDADTIIMAKQMHPKLTLGMTLFFSLGAVGGMISLIMQGKPLFQDAHVWSGIIGLLLLYTQGMLSLFFEDDGNARTAHAYFGTAIMGLFVVHAGLGLQLGLSL